MADNQDLIEYFNNLPEQAKTGPASEQTLQALLDHFTGRSSSAGANKDKKIQQDLNKAKKEEKEEIKTINQQLRKWETSLFESERGMYSLYVGTKMFGSQLMTGRASIESFGDTLVEMADQTGNKFLFGLAKSFQVLTRIVDQQIDNFKQLSEVGVQFSDGLFTTRELALRAGVSLDVFTQNLGKSSSTFALLGGSVRAGTERFTEISRLLQTEFRSQANALGLTFEETTDYLTDYLEIQTAQGKAQTMTDRQLNQGAQEFIVQLDQLAAITGKQRKQLADQLKSEMQETRIKAAVQAVEASGAKNIQGIVMAMSTLPASMQEGFKVLIGTAGVPIGDMAESLVRLNPNLMEFFRRVANGQGTVAEFEAMVRQTANRSQALGSSFQAQGRLLSTLGINTLEANVQMFNQTKFGLQRNKVEQEQTEAMKAMSNQILGFKDSLKDIQNFIITALMPALKVLGFVLGGIAKIVSGLTSSLINSENAVVSFIGSLGAAVLALGALKVAAGALRLAFSGIGGIMSKFMPTLGGGGATKAVVASSALGKAGPAVAKGGLFAGLGLGALLGLGGAGAGLGIAAIGKGLQTFNNVDGKNLSEVADATKKMVMAMVSGVANGGDLAQGVSGLRTYAKSMSQALDDLDKDKLSLYTTKLEELAGAFREVNTSMSGAITSSGRTNQDKLDGISTLLAEIKLVMEDVANSNKNISRKTSNSNVYNT